MGAGGLSRISRQQKQGVGAAPLCKRGEQLCQGCPRLVRTVLARLHLLPPVYHELAEPDLCPHTKPCGVLNERGGCKA